ncbi:MAG: hypothetical protein K2M76_07810, partial [Muribaculaceae bacterium]|nr:hypothetical protein [Muribaculaceae bacterium]
DKVMYAAQKAQVNGLKDEIKNNSAVISSLQARCAELERELNARDAELENVTPPEYKADMPPVVPQAPSAPAVPVDMHDVVERLDRLAELVKDSAYKDGIIKDLHAALQEQQSDFLAKMIKPYMMSVVKIHDRLLATERYVLKPEVINAPDAVQTMVKKIGADRQMVADLLEDDYSLEYFEPSVGDAYDTKAHNAIQSLEPPVAELGSTVAECRQGGFRDACTGKVVKPAVIVVYKAAY